MLTTQLHSDTYFKAWLEYARTGQESAIKYAKPRSRRDIPVLLKRIKLYNELGERIASGEGTQTDRNCWQYKRNCIRDEFHREYQYKKYGSDTERLTNSDKD